MNKSLTQHDMGIANLAGYSNLSGKQKEILNKIFLGFDNEMTYFNQLFDIRALNLGIDADIYFILEQPVFYVFLLNDNQIELESKLFFRLELIKYLIGLFARTLNDFKNRAMEFDLFKFENEQVKGNIAYGGMNNLRGGNNGQ